MNTHTDSSISQQSSLYTKLENAIHKLSFAIIIIGIPLLLVPWPIQTPGLFGLILLCQFSSLLNESKKFVYFIETDQIDYKFCNWNPSRGSNFFMLIWVPFLIAICVALLLYGKQQSIVTYISISLILLFPFVEGFLRSYQVFAIDPDGIHMRNQKVFWYRFYGFEFLPDEKENLLLSIDPQGRGFKNPLPIRISVRKEDQIEISNLLSHYIPQANPAKT